MADPLGYLRVRAAEVSEIAPAAGRLEQWCPFEVRASWPNRCGCEGCTVDQAQYAFKRWLDRMKLWLDADATPREVKEICFRASERLALDTVLVANHRIPIPAGNPLLSTVRVDGGPDVADLYIAEHAVDGDVAVTADIPLAALLVPKGVVVIDPRGDEYTAESIGERLSVRNFMEGLRSTGIETGGHGAFGAREKQAFANALDRALTRARRRA